MNSGSNFSVFIRRSTINSWVIKSQEFLIGRGQRSWPKLPARLRLWSWKARPGKALNYRHRTSYEMQKELPLQRRRRRRSWFFLLPSHIDCESVNSIILWRNYREKLTIDDRCPNLNKIVPWPTVLYTRIPASPNCYIQTTFGKHCWGTFCQFRQWVVTIAFGWREQSWQYPAHSAYEESGMDWSENLCILWPPSM